MSTTTAAFKVVSFSLLALSLGACQAVAGIEDRKLDPRLDFPQECEDYCSVVMAACTGSNKVYTNEQQCLSVCAKLDLGDSQEPTDDNTVACRAAQAASAVDEPNGYCRFAGPGGNGACGTDCEAYCQLYPKICPSSPSAPPEYTSTEDCLRGCSGLTEQKTYDLMKDHDGDTLECRLVHMTSATADPVTHCKHATIRPNLDYCSGKAEAEPTCEQYCDIELVACSGELAQYESRAQCLAVCKALTPGRNDDQTGNTVACRRYHSFSSTSAPAQHCYHSGPTGDGHCGDTSRVAEGHTGPCESYCQLVATACPDEFEGELGSPEECMAACVKLLEADYDSNFTIRTARKSTGLACRVLHTMNKLEDMTNSTACESAMGRGSCE